MNKVTKEILNKEEYNFINSNENLGENIIYLTLSGSIGYGTNIDNSDIDLRGITIERRENIYGFQSFEQFEDAATDTVIYGLRKFVSLALKGNPNILELLGTKDEHIIYMNKCGEALRKNRGLFLSKRVIHTFGNYATAQLRRLQNALARDEYPKEEKEKHILNTINNQMNHFSSNYTKLPKGSIKLYIDKSDKNEIETEILMDIHIDKYSLRDFKSIYSEMSNIVHDYDKLNHRNRKKDDGKLLKHAMHLIRLLIMGTEILKTHEINTYRENEHDLLMDIRKGKYSYDELFKLVELYDFNFKEASVNTTLPKEPDERQVEELLISLYERYYNGTRKIIK
ncbi:nucleotidyltransferase domain-containing protein [Clostridium beijerinckii]|uniref:nucleotidyltransferase domain-containing protein n=1 Tax=Clostridium beijerinckii TaxID=1520 RepID=UPI0003D352D1|nr:nucleotidyltransferase domain-containing protein [Clostridium beijerinckii]ALB45296.1 nucleotidyltransferase domain-containing protein [Clostridium beijerinckii NRRL B-598]